MIWQPEFTDKTLSRKPGAVHVDLERVMTARKKYFTTSAEKQNANAAREKKQEAAE
ncbi:hypothetical protein AB1X99_19575 [Shigella flexneri]